MKLDARFISLKEQRKVVAFLKLLWLLIISAMTAIKYSPEYLNADILLNSIMSLQKITLYYWGQNRLLNILPLLAYPIANPSYSLILIIFVTSATLFALVLLISKFVTRSFGGGGEADRVFLALSALVVLSLTPHGISEIILWHIEYSLSALLAGYAIYTAWFYDGKNYKKLTIVAVFTFISLGINPSTVLALIFIIFVVVLYKRKVSCGDLFVVTSAVSSFVFWEFLSRMYGGPNYNHFSFNSLSSGLYIVVSGLTSAINLPVIFFILIIWLIWKSFCQLYRKENIFIVSSKGYIFNSILLFSISWLIFFTCSNWVHVNQYSWRYFIYIFFGVFIMAGFELAFFFRVVGGKVSWGITIALLVITTLSTYSAPVSFSDFKVFKRVENLAPQPQSLYAGNYWVVWPAVLRDLMLGVPAFGLGYRGESNGIAVKEYVAQRVEKNGYFSVLCLEDTVESCQNQISHIVGPSFVEESNALNEHAVQLKLVNSTIK